ncbi:MAG TPA: tetratricopeptide repeat protein, partial [Bacteroidia bacterium]|nr:tetratricopeptide repeat protein [Bacteroidia bacterium]
MKYFLNILSDSRKRLLFAGILLLIVIAYSSGIHDDFLRGWDDGVYLFQNNYLYHLNFANFKYMLTHQEQGNYHPITMISYAIEYHFFGLSSPVPYHIDNLLLHIAITIFVFYFIFLLTKNYFLAFGVMLLFGIHPIHVESVTWISERKDLLYSFFYMLALINYLRYSSTSEKKYYRYSLILFVLSCLSKGMAVSLAGVIVVIDIFQNKKFDKKTIMDKVPYFALALLFGIIAVKAQGHSVQTNIPYTVSERFRIVNYTIIAFFQKLIAPINLCGFYPYPAKPDNQLESYYWLFPLATFAIAGFTIYSMRFTKKIFFCLGFFMASIIMVLQILPVGGACMADRYAYIPSIGFFLLMVYAAEFLWNYFQKNMPVKFLLGIIAASYLLWLPINTYAYCKIWDGNFKFYDDVLQKYPLSTVMRYNRGRELYKLDKDEEAMKDFQFCMAAEPDDYKPVLMVGTEHYKLKQYRTAIGFYNKAISMNDTCFDAFNNRAVSYAMLHINDSALASFNKALQLRPNDKDAIGNRAILLKGSEGAQQTDTLSQKIIADPKNPLLYYQRGLFYYQNKNYANAMADFNKALSLKNKYTDALYYRAIVEDAMNRPDDAMADYNKVIRIDPKYEEAYNNRGIEYGKAGKLDLALKDFKKVIEINPNNRDAYYNIGFTYHIMKEDDIACPYIKKAAEMGNA